MCASDNIAIYISLFVGMRLWEIVLTIALYYILLLVSIVLASLLIQVIIISWVTTVAVIDDSHCVTIETDTHAYTHMCFNSISVPHRHPYFAQHQNRTRLQLISPPSSPSPPLSGPGWPALSRTILNISYQHYWCPSDCTYCRTV